MKIGLYQHGSTPAEGVAEALAERDQKVAFRNALYFNGNELEKFETVVVDEGKNAEAVRAAYEDAGVTVLDLAGFLEGEGGSAASSANSVPVAAKGDATFNPDDKPKGKKPKKQG